MAAMPESIGFRHRSPGSGRIVEFSILPFVQFRVSVGEREFGLLPVLIAGNMIAQVRTGMISLGIETRVRPKSRLADTEWMNLSK